MSNIKTLVTQAIDEQANAKHYTTPFRTTIERVREGDLVAYIAKGEDGEPEIEHLLEVDTVAYDDWMDSYTLVFANGHYRQSVPGLPLTVARRK